MNAENAKKISIIDYLEKEHHTPVKITPSSAFYRSPLRSESKASFHVDRNRNLWYDYGLGEGGSIIDLVMILHGLTVSEALKHLTGTGIGTTTKVIRAPEYERKFQLVRVMELSSPALTWYLTKRCIPLEIARMFCSEVHYLYQSREYYAIGFPTDAGGYELRNPYFKGSISPKGITTIANGTRLCQIFEGFFDYLSFLTLDFKSKGEINREDALVLNSVANLDKAMPLLGEYDAIELYLDNDDAGRMAVAKCFATLGSRCIDRSNQLYPYCKDTNEWLCRIMANGTT